MVRLTQYIDGIAVPVPELYLAGNNAGIPKENLNNYVIKRLAEKLAAYEDGEGERSERDGKLKGK